MPPSSVDREVQSSLAVSLIIPTLNEEASIGPLVEYLKHSSGTPPHEVIVVDGGSTDHTLKHARAAGAKVLKSERGRGNQLNAGWRAAHGEWCLFLHADSSMQPGYLSVLQQSLQQHEALHHQVPRWGCFESIKVTGLPVWQTCILQWSVSLRTTLLHQPYGDQGIFVARRELEELQGFKPWRLLEDIELVTRLRRRSDPVIVPGAITTSGRRWQSLGFLRTTLTNQLVLMGWACGVQPSRLADWYYGPASKPHKAVDRGAAQQSPGQGSGRAPPGSQPRS